MATLSVYDIDERISHFTFESTDIIISSWEKSVVVGKMAEYLHRTSFKSVEHQMHHRFDVWAEMCRVPTTNDKLQGKDLCQGQKLKMSSNRANGTDSIYATSRGSTSKSLSLKTSTHLNKAFRELSSSIGALFIPFDVKSLFANTSNGSGNILTEIR